MCSTCVSSAHAANKKNQDENQHAVIFFFFVICLQLHVAMPDNPLTSLVFLVLLVVSVNKLNCLRMLSGNVVMGRHSMKAVTLPDGRRVPASEFVTLPDGSEEEAVSYEPLTKLPNPALLCSSFLLSLL